MEEHDCRSIVRGSPTSRRISGMGERTKRRPERSLLSINAERIRSLCTRTVYDTLPSGRCLVHGGAHVQANAGNRTRDPSPSGLLAAASL